MVKEGERLSGTVAFNPEHDLAEFNGIGIVVHSIDTLLDDLAEGLPIVLRSGVVFTGADGADIPGNGASHGEHDVSRPAGCIADPHAEQCLHLLLGRGVLGNALFDDRFKGGSNEVLHEVRAGVVTGSALAVKSADKTKLPGVGSRGGLHKGAHFKDAFID